MADFMFNDFCNVPDYHAVVTIQLCELIDAGFFDLSRSDWDFGPKFTQEQHAQLCKKITDHYYYREIALVPPGIWKREFLRKMNEIMPKYIPWYKMVAERYEQLGHSFDYISGDGNTNTVGTNAETSESTTDGRDVTHTEERTTTNSTENGVTRENENSTNDEYYKSRNIFSDFPQTSLAGRNQDYASTGNDTEYERINETQGSRNINADKDANTVTNKDGVITKDTHSVTTGNKNADTTNDEKKDYRENREHVADPLNLLDDITKFDNVDAEIIAEIEPLFSCLLTLNINAW